MLEMAANEVYRMVLWSIIALGLMVTITISFTSLTVKQRTQSASDLLATTGGYMKTKSQQKQWWDLTHDPLITVYDVKFVGNTAVTDANGHELSKEDALKYNQIDRGMPKQNIDAGYLMSINPKKTNMTFYQTGANESIIGNKTYTSFEEVEEAAAKTAGGISLNGPTGVKVMPSRAQGINADQQVTNAFAMPAHYGTKISFKVKTRIPVVFFSGVGKGYKARKLSNSIVGGVLQCETPSLKGNDTLYDQYNQSGKQEANAESRATGMLQAAGGMSSPNQYFGYSAVNVDLSSATKAYYQGQAQQIVKTYTDKISADKTPESVRVDLQAGLNALNNIFTQNGGTFVDPNNNQQVRFTTEEGLTPNLVFAGPNGTTFSANNLPPVDQWPTQEQLGIAGD